MCCGAVKYTALEEFLKKNKRCLRSIGFHDVEISGLNQMGSKDPKLSASMLCRMFNVPQSTPCQEFDCNCLHFRKEGQRLLLNDDGLQCSVGSKRGFDKR
jgi:hypothetical protein